MTFELRDLRTKLLIVAAVLLLLDAAAIGVLLSPIGRGTEARQQRSEQLQRKLLAERKAEAATQGMDQKIDIARQQEESFQHERLIGRYSEMSEKLSRIARDAGVSVSDVKYDDSSARQGGEKAESPAGFTGIGIVISVRGTYAQDMRFINAVERQKTLLLIDAVSFSGMKGDQLTVSVHLTTFLWSAA
jgi:hypothetical protein